MLDIKEIVKSLSDDDKARWIENRTAMRRSYLAAHGSILPITKYTEDDDAFLDLIDIKLALMFDRAGKIESVKALVEKSDGQTTEAAIISDASKMLNGWQTGTKQ